MSSKRRDLLILGGVLAAIIAFLVGMDLVINSPFFNKSPKEASWGVSQVEAQTDDPTAGPEFLVGPPKVIVTLRLIVPPGGLSGMIVDGTTDKNVSITCAPTGQPLERCIPMNTARLGITDLNNLGRGEVVDIGFIMEGVPGNHSLLVRTIQADTDSGEILNIPPITVPFTLP